jgi:transposase
VAFKRALTPEQEEELVEDYADGWSINDVSVIYRVSIRTVYRILADHQVPLKKKRSRRKRKPREKKPIVLQPCGTNAAYQRHRKKGEYPCTPCLEAHAANVRACK